MTEGSAETTRLSAIAVDEGCTNCTSAALPTLKLCQLIAVSWLVWLIVVVPAPCVMVELPPTTTPPCGVVSGASVVCAIKEPGLIRIAVSPVVASHAARRKRPADLSRTNRCVFRSITPSHITRSHYALNRSQRHRQPFSSER